MRFLAIFLLFFSASALAESFVPQYSVAAGVAHYNYADKRHLDNTTMANGTLGYTFSENMAIEFLFGHATSFYTYTSDVVYYFGGAEDSFRPYALGGIGVTNQEENDTGNTTLLGVNAGAGIEYFFSRHISFFSDVRDIYSPTGGNNDWMLNGGIKFSFDCPAPQVSTPEPVPSDGSQGFYELQG